MAALCVCFEVHQPVLLKPYRFFQIGHDHVYEDEPANAQATRQYAEAVLVPNLARLAELVTPAKGLRVAFSLSGTALELLQAHGPAALSALRALAQQPGVELLAQTYYHSLSFLYAPDEFARQVRQHQRATQAQFQQLPTVFRNTEMIYGNDIARAVEKMGFRGILSEGKDSMLMGRSPNHVYAPLGTQVIRALLRNPQLSDDLTLRFADRFWTEFPLTPAKFVAWIDALAPKSDAVINLFLDFRMFAQPGMPEFFTGLVREVAKRASLAFQTPGEVLATYPVKGTYDVPYAATWAETQKDLPAWMSNYMQREALERLYALAPAVAERRDEALMRTWGRLQTADHFYWMRKDVLHRPYPSAYDAYINYTNVLTDLEQQIGPPPGA